MFPRLFPEVPEDLAALGDELLAELLASFRSVSAQLRAGEIDLAEAFGEDVSVDEASAEAMRQWQEAAATVQEIRQIQASRAEAAEAFAEEAAQLDAQFADESEPEPGTEGAQASEETEPASEATEDAEQLAAADDTEGEGEEEGETEGTAAVAEPVTAAAEARAVRYPVVGRRHAVPRSDSGNPVTLVAAAGLSNARVRAGAPMTREEYGQAVIDVHKSMGPVTKVRGGGRERVLIASANAQFPSERTLKRGDEDGNMEKLRAAGIPYAGRDDSEIQTLLAGGVCPPPTPVYTLPDLETTARPVRDFLTTFNADRGGVSLPRVDTVGDLDADAISVITNDDAIDGGTFATKSCADIDCGVWDDTFVDTIAHCRGVDNLMGRTWPEGVARQNSLTMVGLSRTADGKLLDAIDALSIHTAGGAIYGASSTLLYRLQLARVQMISQLRLPPTQRVDVLLPFWAAELFSLDIVNAAEEGRFDTPQDAVAGLLSRFGFNVSYHLDEGIAGSADQEVFSAQTATQLDFPGTQVIARLAIPGTFIRLDTGTLELGLVRDSDLNHENKYELFGEFWENAARIGPAEAAVRLEITICPDGTRAPLASSAITCSST